MLSEVTVIRTKLLPLRPHRRVMVRSRLTRRLLEALDYRLTILQAGAGYGKSTALAALPEEGLPTIWYHLDIEDADPTTFLLYLLYGFRPFCPEAVRLPMALLEEQCGQPAWTASVDALADGLAEHLCGPHLLVIDDAHLLNSSLEALSLLDRLISRAPSSLHIILSTRHTLRLPSLIAWRARGEVLEIRQDELSFTPEEIATLFNRHYRLPLSPAEVSLLADRTEGWPIALQLVWQTLQNRGATTVSEALKRITGPTESLFSYLAQEVLRQQPPPVRDFLLVTAVLREMTPALCDRLREANDSDRMLDYLVENGLFVVDLGGGHIRYHHLFQEFLYQQLPPESAYQAHRRAAECFLELGDREEAVHHFLAAREFERAATILKSLGREMVQAGRLDTLAHWIGALPPEMLEVHPALLVYLGDIARLRSRFNEALGWYQQAEERYRLFNDLRGVGQALRGQARVYLDTVNPAQAEHILQEALRLSDGQEDRESRARLLELLAENRLNLGRPEEAEQLRAQARALREEGPGEAELAVRVLLRTGRLNEARRMLEEQAERERREPVLRPRAHRETLLLLSLILSFQGEAEAAFRCAVEGTERGQILRSPFVTAVGYMRQGHAWLIRNDPQGYVQACRCYQEAIAIGESLAVPRLKVEAFWGLCRAHGFYGELEAATEAAQQGIAIAQQAGDEWITALIRVSLGAGYVLAGEFSGALKWLTEALAAFRECSDPYGEAVARLWLCQVWWRTSDEARLRRDLEELLRLVHTWGYDYLFTRAPLLAPPDPRMSVPLLVYARRAGIHCACAERLLRALGLEGVEFHPGYQLRVQTLGEFRLWRGKREVSPAEWRREKARRLFQVLITYRRGMLDRDQILEMLWPDLDPETARRDFKVALSTLCKVLEPDRSEGFPSAYIVRDGSRYGLRPGADIWLDVEELEALIAEGDRLMEQDPEGALERYRRALALYRGDYLEDCLYEDWSSEERERLMALYLRTADRVAELLARKEAWEDILNLCQEVLTRDPCWESAYRWMMLAYARTGRRAQAARVYQRCVQRLRDELQVEPSPATVQLYEAICGSS
ncbi:MAG: transcriptional regulator [Anaerolineae bacterium]|nr:transcriptional regulator [Anaerolineae bacterium]MCX8068524.1 transcriptional regulator [Anaerolineae bacterium]